MITASIIDYKPGHNRKAITSGEHVSTAVRPHPSPMMMRAFQNGGWPTSRRLIVSLSAAEVTETEDANALPILDQGRTVRISPRCDRRQVLWRLAPRSRFCGGWQASCLNARRLAKQKSRHARANFRLKLCSVLHRS